MWTPRYTMAKLPLPISFKRLYLPTAMEGSEGAGRVMTGEVDLPAMVGASGGGGTRVGRKRLLNTGLVEQQQESRRAAGYAE